MMLAKDRAMANCLLVLKRISKSLLKLLANDFIVRCKGVSGITIFSLIFPHVFSSSHRTFYICGSLGDSFHAYGLLDEMLSYYDNSIILVKQSHKPVISLFVSPRHISKVKFIKDEDLYWIRNLTSRIYPVSAYKLDITPSAVYCNEDEICSLYIGDYPYLAHIHLNGYTNYIDLQRLIMGLDAYSLPKMPATPILCRSYVAEEYIVLSLEAFSHYLLEETWVKAIISLINNKGLQVKINNSCGIMTSAYNLIKEDAHVTYVYPAPDQLISLYNSCLGVVGILSGSINIAVQYSMANVFCIWTDAKSITYETCTKFRGRGTQRYWLRESVNFPCTNQKTVHDFDAKCSSLDDLNKALGTFIDEIQAAK